MARPRTPIGTFGEIAVETLPDGRGRASTRFRDYDGQLRRVQATSGSPRAAERKLKELVAERTKIVGQGELSPASSGTWSTSGSPTWISREGWHPAPEPSTSAT